jgi:hypothetical protein
VQIEEETDNAVEEVDQSNETPDIIAFLSMCRQGRFSFYSPKSQKSKKDSQITHVKFLSPSFISAD